MASLQPRRAAARPSDGHPSDGGERLCVGVVTGARGLKGEVRIKSFTAEPDGIADYAPITDESGQRQFRLTIVGHHKDQLVVRIDGVADRDAADALNRTHLYVPRHVLPVPAEDEYYHADLIGLTVEAPDGTPLGRVKAVHDFGAGDILEIRDADGREALIPFSRAVVPVVDLDGGRLVVDPPPGLLDERPADDAAEAAQP